MGYVRALCRNGTYVLKLKLPLERIIIIDNTKISAISQSITWNMCRLVETKNCKNAELLKEFKVLEREQWPSEIEIKGLYQMCFRNKRDYRNYLEDSFVTAQNRCRVVQPNVRGDSVLLKSPTRTRLCSWNFTCEIEFITKPYVTGWHSRYW